ncbi:hypothetical protein [Runella limosa]|uniref:hypothetical protein n=1 Tax=Runella limosa TaxID=370978 RepID=UPI0004206625|nr:hypothetical protein [Runella limosa]
MKKYLYASLFFAVALLAGCSKTEPEPEPAEQVIGTYNVDKITESIKYATATSEISETISLPIKGNGYELTAVLDVAKKASNIVTIAFVQTVKYTNGQTEKDSDAFDSIELKKVEGTSEYEMLDTGVKIGTIGNNTITFENVSNEKDSLGRAYTYTFRMTGKKSI